MLLETEPVTIASGAALSDAAGLAGRVLVGIAMPGAWSAADLTFQASVDGGSTWLEVYGTGGSAVQYQAAANRFVAIDPAAWRGVRHLKVRSGTASVPANQGGDRILTLVMLPA